MSNKVLILGDPTSIHTKKWLEGWKFLEYDVALSGLSDVLADNRLIFNEKIEPTGGNGIKYIRNIFNFYNVLKRENPNIINAHSMTSYGLISALLKKKNQKLVLFLPGSDVMIDMHKNFIYKYLSKYILSKSDILVSVSQTMTDKILASFPYLKDKILTQQYGVDIDFLNEYKTDEKSMDIVSNRQWKVNSNYDVILKTLHKFTDKDIILIGNDNNDYANNLLEKYNDLKPFNIGVTDYQKNISYVSKSKIFISLTSSDGTPLSLIEAMYLGAIPIVSNIDTNKELIKNGINGFISEIDSSDLENKINQVLNLTDIEIKEIQEYNKQLVLDKFDFVKNFKKLKRKLIEI